MTVLVALAASEASGALVASADLVVSEAACSEIPLGQASVISEEAGSHPSRVSQVEGVPLRR